VTAANIKRTVSGSSWYDNIDYYQIYDIRVTNLGNKRVTELKLAVTPQATATTNGMWNMYLSSPPDVYYVDTYWDLRHPGDVSVEAGFILRSRSNAAVETTPAISVVSVVCVPNLDGE